MRFSCCNVFPHCLWQLRFKNLLFTKILCKSIRKSVKCRNVLTNQLRRLANHLQCLLEVKIAGCPGKQFVHAADPKLIGRKSHRSRVKVIPLEHPIETACISQKQRESPRAGTPHRQRRSIPRISV